MKIAWCITGAGHFLEESYEVFRTIKRGVRPSPSNLKPQTSNLKITIFISNAGVEVLRMYGIFDKLKEISNGDYMEEIFTAKEQGSSSPKAGRFSLRKYDAVVVSPATSNTVAKIAYGIADSLVTNVVSLATKACIPVYIVPTDGSPGKVESEMPYSIDRDKCRGCDDCEPRDRCERDAIYGAPIPQIDLLRCDGCGLCRELCPYDAINGGVVEIKAREIDIRNVEGLRKMEGIVILERPEHFFFFYKKNNIYIPIAHTLTEENMTKEANKHLLFGGVDVAELAERYGTPLYVTDENKLKANFRNYKNTFSSTTTITDIYYAVKANGNLALLKILASEGAGADVFSAGELELTKLAGIPAEKILFNGNSKSDDDLKEAVESGVRVSVDSVDELRALSAVANELGREVEIAIRVNPDVSPDVHAKIATGLKESKFGIPFHDVIPVCEEAEKLPNVLLAGLHCHIGSQILDITVFGEATEKMMALVERVYERGMKLKFVDLGGGLGIGYRQAEKATAPTPKDLAEMILPLFEKKMQELGISLKLVLEPGRSVVGASTILLSRVNAVKRANKNFVAIDAGFNLLIRPVMYDAYHEVVVANKVNEQALELYTIVGNVCEAGDIIAKDRMLPKVERGDLVAILDTGAYGFSMSSQYNGRPRCAEVLVCDGKADLIRSRESIEDLIRNQKIPTKLT